MRLKNIISGLLGICLSITFASTVMAETTELKDIKDLPEIREYQDILDKINLELGSEISIPDNESIEEVSLDRQAIYDNIINQSLDEFEENVRKDYHEFINGTYATKETKDQGTRVVIPINKTLTTDYEPLSSGRILQKRSVYSSVGENRGAVDLESRVFSSSGSAGSYVYTDIYALGYYSYTDRTHFRAVVGSSYVLSSDAKKCTAKYNGSYYTAAGLQLSGLITYTIEYYAGLIM